MREVKFRFYDTHKKTMFTTGEVNDYEVWDCIKSDRFKCNQYTGIEDSKATELCRGDICRVDGLGNCEVDICKFYGTVFKKDGCEYPVIDSIAEDDSFEVIGNIYENPELLKGDL